MSEDVNLFDKYELKSKVAIFCSELNKPPPLYRSDLADSTAVCIYINHPPGEVWAWMQDTFGNEWLFDQTTSNPNEFYYWFLNEAHAVAALLKFDGSVRIENTEPKLQFRPYR